MAVVLVEELEWVVSISGKTVTNEFRVNRPPITPLSSVSTGIILMLIKVDDNILVISKEPVDFSLVLYLFPMRSAPYKKSMPAIILIMILRPEPRSPKYGFMAGETAKA